MYDGATTAVRLRDGESKEFGVKVGVHQGSVLVRFYLPLSWKHYLESLEVRSAMGATLRLMI